MSVRAVGDLVDDEGSAWPGLLRAVAGARTDARLLDADSTHPDVLARLQVTTRSPLGAMAFHCGGLVLDHGWLRVLGGGAEGLPDLAVANAIGTPDGSSRPPLWLVVAYDVLGGRFAVDSGGLGAGHGQVCYWGPDTLEWNSLGAGHAAFLAWALDGGTAEFYAEHRWEGWEGEVSALGLDQGISVWPPPFTEQPDGAPPPSRRPVPFADLLRFYDDAERQVAGLGEGESFTLRVGPGPAEGSPAAHGG